MAELQRSSGNERHQVTEATRDRITYSLTGHWKDFNFYSDSILKDSIEQMSAMV